MLRQSIHRLRCRHLCNRQKIAAGSLSNRAHLFNEQSNMCETNELTMDSFALDLKIPLTPVLSIVEPSMSPTWPVYRVLLTDGTIAEGAIEPVINSETLIRVLNFMIRVRAMDDIFYSAQRQGRMSFYATSTGEEAIQIGSAAALDINDMIFAQYREPGLLMWRGFPIQGFADQCIGNVDDFGHGRQMPVHYGSRDLNHMTISTPLATQIPQAVGAAYAFKQKGLSQIPICFFGDGAASEGDFHGALNFAATLECPVVFLCRNNGYAISTPTKEQYRGDGIVSRAAGYGMAGIRVDGNDTLAVYAATKEARAFALSHNKPVLIEAMTYRVGHHSTSDDWSSYRSADEVKPWQEERDPINRLSKYLTRKGYINEFEIQKLVGLERGSVMAALEEAEKKDRPPLSTIFEDVYCEMPPNLREQQNELLRHLKKYPEQYPQKK